MDSFLRWIGQLRDRAGKRTGTISLWLKGHEERSYTLLLSADGVELREPALGSADLVLCFEPECFASWLDGSLDPASLGRGDLAWDGDLRLFQELGFRMSNAPMLPHQSLLQHLTQE